ncbi:hypothetical protein Salat_0008200 [Sesamum alatum]|uniref:Pectinesterase inhibitor domain-containing protein n=1 Tax=Sesamum alatum TaxID=300844 RepID=A0AAE2CW82_9LAMI|nr:hypothetical protein Salat_0008200 [Sesamum alatum]
MGSSTLCCLISMVVLFLWIPYAMGDGATQARINAICRQTDDFNYCRGVFNGHLPGDVVDVKGLTQIAIRQTLIYASDTQIVIKRLEARNNSSELKNLLKICEVGYGIIVDQFGTANLDFAKGDYRSMLFDVEKCPRYVNDCIFVLSGRVPELKVKNSQALVLVRMSIVSGTELNNGGTKDHTHTTPPIAI